VREAWQRTYEATVSRAKLIFSPIQNVLRILCEKDKGLSRKYKIWFSSGALSLIVGGIIGGVVIAHYLPTVMCTLSLTSVLCAAGCGTALASVFPPALAVVALIGIGFGIYAIYKGVRTRKEHSRLYQVRVKLRAWLLKRFPNFTKLTGNIEEKLTEEQFTKNTQEVLMQMKVDETTWVSDILLETWKYDIENDYRELTAKRDAWLARND
jgi:hypothetical protein